MKSLKITFPLILMLCFTACAAPKEEANDLTPVTLMLDYTPNTNHTGFYVAVEKGYYKDAGLDIEIIEPGDNSTTSMTATGKADFGVSYQEDVTYALTAPDPLPIKAIAAIIQHNTSGFVSLKNADIHSPKDFEGKTYAGWNAPSEEAVIQAVMKKANADFSKLTIVGADGSGIAGLSEEAEQDKVNIQWEYYGWAVTKALMDGFELNYLPCNELDSRLDYYTPVIITNEDMIENQTDICQKFIDATRKGYEYTIENPDEAAEILHDQALKDVDLDFLKESQKYLSSQYALDAEKWGVMKDEVWDDYTDFMLEYQLIDRRIEARNQYTNEFIK